MLNRPTFGVHITLSHPPLSESRKKESWEICLVQNVSPDGPLNGTFIVIPTRRKQSGGHPATRLLCFQAPPPRLTRRGGYGQAFYGLRARARKMPAVAPEMQSLEPLRGKLARFCPWGTVVGTSAGQFGAVFAPEVQSLGPPRGNLARFCPWDAVVGASAGQIRPFLPLRCSRWGHRGAI